MSTVVDPKELFSDTVTSLWLGAGRAAGNATLGGLGSALQGLGSFFEPTEQQRQKQREIYSQTAGFVGLPEEFRVGDYYHPNALTIAGRYLLDANAKVQNNVQQAREDLLGNRQGLYTKAAEGVGAMLIPFLLGQAGTAGKAAKSLFEAGAEAGNLATNDNQNASLNNFLANLALNAGLEALPDGAELLELYDNVRQWTPFQKIIADLGKEMLEQVAVQEPIQRIIQDASQEQDWFAENMIKGLTDYPKKAADVIMGRE